MAFKNACVELVNSLSDDDMNREIVIFLLENAVGVDNLKSWTNIEAHLKSSGFDPQKGAKEHFQVTFLGKTRESDSFIGSTNRGYYIIDSLEDAYACLSFYLQKMSSMQNRVENLRKLMDQEYLENT